MSGMASYVVHVVLSCLSPEQLSRGHVLLLFGVSCHSVVQHSCMQGTHFLLHTGDRPGWLAVGHAAAHCCLPGEQPGGLAGHPHPHPRFPLLAARPRCQGEQNKDNTNFYLIECWEIIPMPVWLNAGSQYQFLFDGALGLI